MPQRSYRIKWVEQFSANQKSHLKMEIILSYLLSKRGHLFPELLERPKHLIEQFVPQQFTTEIPNINKSYFYNF